MFRWFKEIGRKRVRRRALPESWLDAIRANVAHFCMLGEGGQARLLELVKVFADEKHWEGAGGLVLTDEIIATVSAQACLLLLGLPHDYYRNVQSIVIYPSTVVVPQREPGFFEGVRGPLDPAQPVLGQAWLQGPVILVWDAVKRGGIHPESGHNLVYHEFAHKLDMLDGGADGTPPIRDSDEFARWVNVCSEEYLRLKKDAERGNKSLLDAYGATNEAEFFAVATEEFFDRPDRLKKSSPELYSVLMGYYRQDPEARMGVSNCGP